MPADLILLVEDDESVRALLARFLESLGYPPPLQATNARQALGLARERRPDLVLMDIGLPGDMDGVEAAQRLRENLGLPIIFITAHGDPDTLERTAAARPVGYLVKPVNRLDLYGAIKTGLERHRLERDLAERTEQLAQVNEQLRRRQADLELQNLALKQAEQAIQEGHERYRQLFETNQAVKLVVDPEDGSIVDANQAACEFYGYTRREIVNKKVFDINPAPPEKVLGAMAKALAGDKLAFEFQHRLASGERRDVEVYTGPMNWGGRILLHSIIHDVTQRRRAEEALRQSQRQASFLADLLDHSSQPFAVAYADGSLGRYNQAFLDLVGYSAQELAQMDWTRDLTPPQWREDQERRQAELLRTGQSVRYEKEYQRKDGSLVPVEVLAHLVRDQEGRPQYYYGFVTDITERKQAERALRESEERFRALFEQAAVGVAEIDSQSGRFLRVNDKHCQIMGHSRETLLASTFMDITHPEDLAADLEHMRQLREGLISEFSLEKRHIRADGSVVWINLTVAPLWGLGQPPSRHIAVAQDITQRKQAEEDLRCLISGNPESALLVDPYGTILAINRASAARLGKSEAEAVGQNVFDLLPKDLAGPRRQRIQEVTRTGQPLRFVDVQHGTHLDNYLHPILDAGGQVSRVAIFAVDITESVLAQERLAQALEGLEATVRERTRELREEIAQRQAAQEALEESQRRLRRAVQWAPVPMMIHAEDGEVLLVNDVWSELSGYTLADIPTVGRWADLAYGPGQEWIKKAIIKLYHLDRHMDAGEFQVRAKDGRLLIWHFSGAPLGTGADGRRLAISVAMDVTQRKQDEEALRLERRRLASVIAGTNIGTWEWNVQTGETVYNQRWAEMLGYTLEELAPLSIQTWLDLAHPQDLAASNDLLARHFTGELEYYDCECRMRHKDGHWVWVHDRGKVVEWTAQGQPLLMSGTHADITQRKQAEEKISSLARFPSENPNPVMRFTADSSLLYANEAAARLLQKLWAGREYQEEQPRSFRDAASWALATGHLQTAEVQAADDTYTLTFVPVAGSGYVNVYGMDITGRKRAEESIRVLAKFPDENPNPVLRVSAQGVINYANQACQRCLGTDNCQVGQPAPAILAPGLAVGGVAGQGSEFEVEVTGRTFLFSAAPVSETGDIYLYGRDVTERRQLEHQRQMAGVVFDNSLEAIIIADPQGKVQMVNSAYTSITGYGAEEIIGKDLNIFRSEQDDQAFYQELWEGLTRRGRWSGEYWNRRKDGEAYPEWINVVLVRDSQDNIANFVVIFHDITDIKSKEERIKHQAYHDALTGLPNRVLFNDRLGQAIAHADREGSRLAVAFLDLDNFKRVNDSLGHQAGDLLLQETARRLKGCLRETDTVSRLGGDEFTIILPEASRPQDTMEVTSRILAALARPFSIQGHDLFITTSMGITFYPDDARDSEGLLKNADMAMYRAKEQGRNNVQLFTPALNDEMQHRLRLESQLRQALERDEFILHYQPKVDVASGLVVGMEALVRWQRPGQGLAMPGSFISLAEETGLILPMGELVLAKACQQAQAWRQTGHPYLCVSVNLSPRQFEQENLVEMVEGILNQTGLPSVCLELEITEGAMMKDVDKALAKLVGLASMGVRLSLDDFGTGYSSLSYLKRFSLSSLKIDQTFVRDLTVDANDAAIVQTIIAMGHALGLQVVAEGVETLEQLSFLRTHGCDEYQGYYFSRPLAPEAFLALLTGAPLA